jgi:hypothetical protein
LIERDHAELQRQSLATKGFAVMIFGGNSMNIPNLMYFENPVKNAEISGQGANIL